MGNQALYLSWSLGTAEAPAAEFARSVLTRGETRNLYRLCSWVIAGGEVRALLAPAAPLESITENVWAGNVKPLVTRWVSGTHACARVSREIETTPVALGLAARPEQWPWSSAATE